MSVRRSRNREGKADGKARRTDVRAVEDATDVSLLELDGILFPTRSRESVS
jgi:hypothetical protein